MHLHRSLRRPVPAARASRLERLRSWLLDEHGDGPTCTDRARIAALLRAAPPH